MAFGGYLFEKNLYIEDSENPIKSFLYSVHEVEKELASTKLPVKLFYSAVVGFTRSNNFKRSEHMVEYVHMVLNPIVIMQESDIKIIETMGAEFDQTIHRAIQEGSVFSIVNIKELKIHVAAYINH